MTTTSVTQSNYSSYLPDTAGKAAAIALALMLIAGTVITTIILLEQDPSLNRVFYPVFGVIGGLGFLLFVVSIINMCKKPPTTSLPSPKEKDPKPISQTSTYPYSNGYPSSVMYPPPVIPILPKKSDLGGSV